MRRYVFRLAILALAAAGPTMALADDQQIAQQIVQKLQQEKQAGGLKGFNIELQVEDGTVWMSGRVANADQQAVALDVARRIGGVKQVVNDLSIASPSDTQPRRSSTQNMLRSMSSTVRNAWNRDSDGSKVEAANAEQAEEGLKPIGSGVAEGDNASTPNAGKVQLAQPVYTTAAAPAPMPAPQGYPQPVYAGTQNAVPLPFAPARQVGHEYAEGVPGGPVPMHLPGSGVGIAPARYDHPQMPGYAWPSYASHPNYAAVTYPKQYSPTAWPYIGPFYPYPQVPLGWRKVQLEWDDGWWMLDFRDRRHGLSRGR